VTASREAAKTTLDGLGIERDLDAGLCARDQLVGEREPTATIRDPLLEVLGPAQTDRRQVVRFGLFGLGHAQEHTV